MRAARRAGSAQATSATSGEQHGHAGQDRGVEGRDAVELAGERPAQSEEAAEAEGEADGEQRRSFAEDQPEDRRALAAEGHADADLAARWLTW